MNYELSSAAAVQSKDPEAASHFYGEVLGLTRDSEAEVEFFHAGPLNLFVDSGAYCPGLLMELLVDDLEDARAHLEANGCEVVHWGGVGKACVVRDPFGVHFNLWQR